MSITASHPFPGDAHFDIDHPAARAGEGTGPPLPPWFLGDAPVPRDVLADADRAEAVRDLLGLPFLTATGEFLEFIGEGRRLTGRGDLFVADRKAFERGRRAQEGRHPGFWDGHDPLVQRIWSALLECGWLRREERWVRPAGSRPAHLGSPAALAEEGVDGVLDLLVTALGRLLGGVLGLPWGTGDDDVLDAVLVASGPEGLQLPDHPSDGRLDHCLENSWFLEGLVEHPRIRRVPIDRRTGHVDQQEMQRLVLVSGTIRTLLACGLLHRADPATDSEMYEAGADDWSGRLQGVRAPMLMRDVVSRLRDRRDAARRC